MLNLLTVLIFMGGIYAMVTMQREAFPHVTMDIMVVSASYPGTSPKEVEKLITIPLERALKEVDGIEKIHSVSIEGRSSIVVEIDENLSSLQVEKTKTDIQRAIDRTEDLPSDLEKPIAQEVRSHQMPTLDISLTGLSEHELRNQAKLLEDRLDLISGVSQIGRRGFRDQEFWIEVDPHMLSDFHLSLSGIATSLEAQNMNVPGGTTTPQEEEYLIRTIGEIETKSQIEEAIIRSNDLGFANKIKDVATVTATFDEETRIEKVRGLKAITLVVLKHRTADSIDVVHHVVSEIESFKKTAPSGLEIETSNDASYYVKRRLSVLIGNGWMGMLLVLIVIFIFLSRRIALITALGIPFAFCLTLIILKFSGITINLISMFGLIIVSGMLVDDSIVFAENIYRHMQQGKTAYEASVLGSKEVLLPVIGTVTTTIIAFLPLAFMKGIMGKFIWQIPAVVILALLASLVEAVFILPVHTAHWVDPKKERIHTPEWFLKFRNQYVRLVETLLHHKFKTLGVTLGLFLISLWTLVKVIPFQLFPSEGIEIFFIKAKASVGTPLSVMSQKMAPLETWVSQLSSKELKTFTTQVGILQRDINDPFTQRGTHVAQITVYLTPESDRKRDANEIIRSLQEKAKPLTGFENIWFFKVTPGPPVGKPVSLEIRGDEFSMLQTISGEFKQFLSKQKGVKEIEDSFELGKKELEILVDHSKAAQAGLFVGDIAKTVRAAFEGIVATKITKTDEEIELRVKLAQKFKNEKGVFDLLLVPNSRGQLIPLKEVTRIQQGQGISYIQHYNYKRTISVSTTIDPKETTSVTVNRQLKQKWKELSKKYPGYDVSFGGEQEDTNKSLSSLKEAFVFALFGIFFILCLVFRSLLQPLIVLMSIPLSLIGIAFAFFTHGYPLSFMAILGLVGLTGVVVNNAIILIDLINIRRREGSVIHDAILDACKQRFRPILLTSITTVFGLGPVAYGLGGDDPILRPTALTLSWGLLFATLLTLFIIPCLYLTLEYVLSHVPDKLKFIVHRVRI
ncbi:MAG: efflux RND transporter permease subunit [Deltaproteobacteria bacterium]|nr:efflux RND transporter permease subunit [Deltaproteobacteria bacterium]